MAGILTDQVTTLDSLLYTKKRASIKFVKYYFVKHFQTSSLLFIAFLLVGNNYTSFG